VPVLRVALLFSIVAIFAFTDLARSRKASGFALHLGPSQNAIQPGAATWKTGAPVFLIVTMVNSSKKTVHYSLTNPGFDYVMDVQDESGTPVPETEHPRQMKESLKSGVPIMGRNIIGTLKPRETAQDTIEVSYFYDLRRPGEYSVQVQREFPEVGKEPIKSNRLELGITP
jgi:hypothetical protein